MTPTTEAGGGEVSEHVQIFAEGSFTKGDLTWGWQCFRCRVEETGFGSAATAGEGRDQHAAIDCAPHPTTTEHPAAEAVGESEKP